MVTCTEAVLWSWGAVWKERDVRSPLGHIHLQQVRYGAAALLPHECAFRKADHQEKLQ